MAVLLLGQVVLGKYAHELDRSMEKLNLMMWHKSIGICLLTLVIIRLAWNYLNPQPTPGETAKRWQILAQRLSHAALYFLMVAIPLTGWLMNSAKNIPFRVFRTIPLPDLIPPGEKLGEVFEDWHEGLVEALLVLLTIHVAAAFWHHFYHRDAVLLRMLRQK